MTDSLIEYMHPETDYTYSGECPDCGGQGWYAKQSQGNPPEQIQCENCYGTGILK